MSRNETWITEPADFHWSDEGFKTADNIIDLRLERVF